jgi:hypothetical protein
VAGKVPPSLEKTERKIHNTLQMTGSCVYIAVANKDIKQALRKSIPSFNFTAGFARGLPPPVTRLAARTNAGGVDYQLPLEKLI